MKTFILKYALTLSIIWAFIILGLCSMPGQYIPSANWLELLRFDKFVHASMFFVLCSLIFFYFVQKSNSKYMVYIFFFVAIIYGCSLEIMQGTLFSNRSADWNDIIANTTGCVIALLSYKKMFGWLSKV